MTCIVGLVENNCVYIGGDSASWYADTVTTVADGKVFRNGPMLFGGCGSHRLNVLLRNALVVPQGPAIGDRVDRFMATTFVNAIRACFATAGFRKRENEVETMPGAESFLVGYRGRLFAVYSDLQIDEYEENYTALGSGRSLALGALYVARDRRDGPKRKLLLALGAAAQYDPYVRRPFVVKHLEHRQ
jgi:ATP-dependent protease HslVU (ClpYQ) peptidase subunit